MSEPDAKRQKKSEDDNKDENPINSDLEVMTLDNLISPFEPPNLTLIVEDKKLFVIKELLMAESPVFERMFSSSFKEASAKEIELPGKNLNHFVYFLRYMLPGFSDELTEETVHDMLPLAEEYQTEKLLKRIENFLSDNIKKKGDTITSKQIIIDILEAEHYSFSNYLEECIEVASRKKLKQLAIHQNFHDISKDTQLRISYKRWKTIDAIFNAANIPYETKDRWGDTVQRYKIEMSQVGQHLKPYMQDN